MSRATKAAQPKPEDQPVRVEFSRDGGRTWKVWAYGQHAPKIYNRLIKLYPSWDFTLITPERTWTTHEDMSKWRTY